MSISTAMAMIFTSAQTIDINRTKLVAHTVSRNGKLLVASRNWVNPWRFTVTPRPIWDWQDVRAEFESIINADRFNTQTITIGSNAFNTDQANWIFNYQGGISGANWTNNVLITGATGTSISLQVIGAAAVDVENMAGSDYVLRAGDLIQATGNLYPHAIKQDITKSMGTRVDVGGGNYYYTFSNVGIHRGWLGSAPSNAVALIGAQCTFELVVTMMPTYTMTPPKRFAWNGDFELMEQVA